jgi:competence protein ComEA
MFRTLTAALLAALTFAAQAAVDINKASQAELESLKGIGPAMSERILDERKKGEFKDWGDAIVRVKGVGEGNAARFSAAGLTVGGAGYAGKDKAATAPGAATTTAKAEPKR